jgi:ubiquinone/menaquinone biosynthesis C-methylase UbiE
MAHAPTPPVTPERILDHAWGFARTRALATAVELDLFTLVAAGKRTPETLAQATGATSRGIRMLGDALTSLGLLSKDAGGYALAPDAALFLSRSSPASIADFIAFGAREIDESWAELTRCVKTGKPVKAVDRPVEGIPLWHALVDALFPVNYQAARLVGEELARRHPGKVVRLLDVAAGSGVWGIGAALANPRVSVVAADLPETLEHTKRWVAKTGVASRVTLLPGDLRSTDYGAAAYDAAVLGHICHSEGPVHAPRLLEKVAKALRPGGTVFVAEFVPDEGRAAPPIPLLFALNMLVHTTDGDTWPFSQYRAWLEGAGFRDVVSLPAPAPSPLIVATRS